MEIIVAGSHGIMTLDVKDDKLTAVCLPKKLAPALARQPDDNCMDVEAWYHAYLTEHSPPYHIPWDQLKKLIDTSWWSETAEPTYRAMYEIPWGQTLSYEALGEIAGVNPRVCATHCRKNRFPLLIPCHRVLPKNGSVGNYAFGGEGYKKSLLHWEGVL